MKDICIPIPHFTEDQIAEVGVRIGDKKVNFNFRVESFPWYTEGEEPKENSSVEEISEKIQSLRKTIEGYDKNWELIQIFTPSEGSDHIQILFRQKIKS